jgi:hypothetical protein
LITSAPRSPRSIVAKGPDITLVKSNTLIPSRGKAITLILQGSPIKNRLVKEKYIVKVLTCLPDIFNAFF